MQRFGRIGLTLVVMGLISSACDDDEGDDTDTNSQIGDEDEGADESGSSGSTARAGRSGSSGSTARAGAGAGGATAGARAAGAGGSTSTTAGSGGTAGASTAGGAGGVAGASTAGGAGGSPAAGRGGSGGATSVALNDAQIAAVTTAANTGEISLGMLALSRAQLPAVRVFAQMLIDMHGVAQTRQNAVLDVLDLEVSGNALSAQLETEAMQVSAQLNAAAADQFDLAYVRSQVDIHTKVLTLIDEQLLPNVSAVALRADLTVARTEVAAHLALATGLLEELQDASDAGVP